MNENNNENKMGERVSIRDIEVSDRRERFNHRGDNRPHIENDKGVSYKAKNKKVWPKFVAFGIFAILLFAFVSYFFHSANVEVNPKTEKLTFSNDIYTATVDEKNFTATVSEVKSESGKISKGKIKIINNTAKTQNLREETRFQIGEGESKIVFKTYKKTTVPANGSVIEEAFSDGAGEKYNKEKGTDLKIPGFFEAGMTKEYEGIVGVVEESFVTSDEEIKTDAENTNTEAEETKTSGVIKYQVLELEAQEEKEIDSIAIEEVSEKATGKIKITNNTAETQKLRKETRFGNGDLLFKTYKSVTVPASTSVIVDAFADTAGESHNIKKGMEFDVPGFKEAGMDNEYENISGVAETDFSGGIVGKSNIPNKEELAEAKKELENKVLESLAVKRQKNASGQDFVLVGNNPYTQYNFVTTSEDEKVIVSVKAVQKIPIVMKKDFITMILASEDITTEKADQLEIKDFSGIEFRVVNPGSFNIDSGDNFLFSTKGNAEIAWVLDEETFIQSIKGNSSSELKDRLSSSFKNFEFSISISPFWRTVVPNDPDNISIETKIK